MATISLREAQEHRAIDMAALKAVPTRVCANCQRDVYTHLGDEYVVTKGEALVDRVTEVVWFDDQCGRHLATRGIATKL